jgi:hypothetical protein
VTTRAAFTAEEWNLLVRVPRWLVGASSAAETDNASRTHAEMEAGFIAIASGREMGSAMVSEVAQACMGYFDTNQATEISFAETEVGLATVLERLRAAAQVLRAKADPGDAATYRKWIVDITDVVINASRSGDKLGFGGVAVTPAERHFRDQVVLAVQA